jgi:hypothetical protein
MSPEEKAKKIFNTIRYMDNESGKDCITCDCVVLPIAKFICNLFIEEHSYHNPDRLKHWVAVKAELERL